LQSEEVAAALRPLLEQIRQGTYLEPEKHTDVEALGILMAKFFHWDGTKILEAAKVGLEDSNFHSECRAIEKILQTEDK
jgi:hypothetical protein